MNPGASAEVGKVAVGFIDAMKTQPVSRALCVICLMQLAVLFYVIHNAHENHALEVKQESELRDLLAKCVVPPAKE